MDVQKEVIRLVCRVRKTSDKDWVSSILCQWTDGTTTIYNDGELESSADAVSVMRERLVELFGPGPGLKTTDEGVDYESTVRSTD